MDLVKSFAASIVRHTLGGLGVYFVTHGYFTQAEWANYLAAFTLWIVALGWSFYQKYASLLENQMDAYIARHLAQPNAAK